MILRAMRLRVPLKSWLEAQMVKEPDLDRLTLSNTDWKKLNYLIILLRPFAEFTNLLGSTRDCTINHTWNVYNSLFDHLESVSKKLLAKNQTSNPWIPEFTLAINAGLEKLKDYYTRTGDQVEEQYALAAILDPSQKLDIFSTPAWGPTFVKRYRQTFKEYWEEGYKESSSSIAELNPPAISAPQSLNEIFRRNRETPGVRASAIDNNEAERYLRAPIVSDEAETSVLAIWKRLELSYPSIAKMARDILAVPGK